MLMYVSALPTIVHVHYTSLWWCALHCAQTIARLTTLAWHDHSTVHRRLVPRPHLPVRPREPAGSRWSYPKKSQSLYVAS
jgi:hypothetical protein